MSLKHPDGHVSSLATKLKFKDAIGGMIFIILYLYWIAVASFFMSQTDGAQSQWVY